MDKITKLAQEIRAKNIEKQKLEIDTRITDTLSRFETDFKEVLPVLKECNIDYKSCFAYKKNDTYMLYPIQIEHDFGSGVCTANSIRFTFSRKGVGITKRIFLDEKLGWYYIARSGNFVNANHFLKELKDDLILFLDTTFECEYK